MQDRDQDDHQRHGKQRHKVKVTQQRCTTRLVSGTIKFVIDSDDLSAYVSRARVVCATGFAVPTGDARRQLMLNDLRSLALADTR